MASIEGKVFAITGGASGMGLATCKRLVSLKARAVCIGDFNTSNFEKVTKKLKEVHAGTEILTSKLDVSSSASTDAWYDEIIAKYSALDGVVNCAGLAQRVGGRNPPNILEETDEMWERIIGVNLNGIFYSTRAVAKAMVALPKAPRSIVNIGSIAGILHSGGTYAYGTSKRAVVGLTPALAKDLTPFGIRINGILPSVTATPMLQDFFDLPNGQELPTNIGGHDLVQPDDIGRIAIWLLSDDSARVSGANIPVGGCLT